MSNSIRKKNFDFPGNSTLSVDYLKKFIDEYSLYFKAHRFDNTETAFNYAQGLMKCAKGEANMERMEEEIENSVYRATQQFISNSNWDREGLQKKTALDASQLLDAKKQVNGLPTGYIIDESGHLKKGDKSVGVSRQYAGVAGKVDNCQVGVYASLVNGIYATIINECLFLPKSWTDHVDRCEDVGIPKAAMIFKTKPELALEMIKQDIERGVKFDWIGGDGLYGHNYELGKGLDILGLFFVLDVHKDETVFTEEPKLEVPVRKSSKGYNPTKLKADKQAIRLDKLIEQIKPEEWRLEEIRDATKGKLILYVYKTTVWSWDGEEKKARKRTLIITKTTDNKPRVKYSFSNGEADQYSHQEYAYFVSQRYWVERTFDNAKNDLGMSDYQIRKWKGWHNHHALVMLASLFIMKQQMDNHSQVPLLSFRDARILVILQIYGSEKEIRQRLDQMYKRHTKRKYDIDLNYQIQTGNRFG